MDLKEVSKDDKYFRNYALKLCGDYHFANDLVQDMYLKIINVNKDYSKFYAVAIIRNLFLDAKRKEINKDGKKIIIPVEELFYLKDLNSNFEPDDYEIKLLENFEKLPFHQRELIEESYTKSLREMEKEFNINYGYIYRELKKAKENLLKNE